MESQGKMTGGIREPGSGEPGAIGLEDAEKHEVAADKHGFFRIREEAVRSNREDSFTTSESELMEYKSRPLGQVIVFGLLAVIFFSARFWLFPLDEALGNPLGRNLGWITLCSMFVGAYCAFMAWPKYKYKGLSDEEHDERVKSREEFRKKFRR